MNPFKLWLDAIRRFLDGLPKPKPPGPDIDGHIVFEYVAKQEDKLGACIAQMPIDGSAEPKFLTDWGQNRDWGPHSNHAGDTILFKRDRIGHRGSLQAQTWLMDRDGTNPRLIQQRGDHGFTDAGHHEFSLDDQHLYFAASHKNHKSFAIYEMRVDGTALVRLTDGSRLDADPSVCADGSILFTRRAAISSQGQEIWIMNPDGTEQTQLTFDPQTDAQAEWDCFNSPDGNQIVYLRQTSELGLSPWDNWLMNIDGTGQRIVADGSEEGVSFGVARWVDDDWIVGSWAKPWKGRQIIAYRATQPEKKTVVWAGDTQAGGRDPHPLPE